ncbi:hypothetical protein J6590_067701 [Homalodisca vitripennis]|nr:hypothetical protein J6590_067701 [Homalodisca vitripennis]
MEVEVIRRLDAINMRSNSAVTSDVGLELEEEEEDEYQFSKRLSQYIITTIANIYNPVVLRTNFVKSTTDKSYIPFEYTHGPIYETGSIESDCHLQQLLPQYVRAPGLSPVSELKIKMAADTDGVSMQQNY